MNLVGQIIEQNCPNSHYNFQSVAVGLAGQYIVHSENRDDMQFLYEGTDVQGAIGHWIFVYFVSKTKKLHIYNSMNTNFLSAKYIQDVSRLYPYINIRTDIIFEKIQNQQKNTFACGVYASAYAVSKALGKNPSEINFKIPISHLNDEVLFLRVE